MRLWSVKLVIYSGMYTCISYFLTMYFFTKFYMFVYLYFVYLYFICLCMFCKCERIVVENTPLQTVTKMRLVWEIFLNSWYVCGSISEFLASILNHIMTSIIYSFPAEVECGVVQSLPPAYQTQLIFFFILFVTEEFSIPEDYIDTPLEYCIVFFYIIYVCCVINLVSEWYFPLLEMKRSVSEDW